jgi:hypothetical protein
MMEQHNFLRIFCGECGTSVDVPVYCGDRFCPTCSKPRSARIYDRINFLIKNTKLGPHERYRFLTLTVESQPDLKKMIKFVLKSFRRLRQRAYWRNQVSGGCFVIEVKYGKYGWHVHLHAIVVSKYMPQKILLAHWRKIAGRAGVHIMGIKSSAVIGYISKYMTKPSVLPEKLPEVNAAMKGLRLFSPFGTWYNMNKLYIRRVCGCPECGVSHWTVWDIIHDKPMTTVLKEFTQDGWKIVEGYEPLHDKPLPCYVGKKINLQ